MNGIIIAKGTVKAMSSIGVGTVVGNAWRAFVPAEVGIARKVCCEVGGIVIGGLVTYKADNYLDEVFNDCAEMVNAVKEAVNKQKVQVEVKVEEKKETKKKETKKKSNKKAKKDVIEVEVPPEDIEIVEEVEEA